MTHMLIAEAVAALGIASAGLAAHMMTRRGRGVSILIPFRCPSAGDQRTKNVEWLKRYWRAQLPGAEVIVGEDDSEGQPFSKSKAVNDAASRASGDVFVIVDADGYIPVDRVEHCVAEIRRARKAGQRLWFVPYRMFYRLTEAGSRLLLASDPRKPHRFASPLPQEYVLNDTDPAIGHWYGAMIQIMPREAFECVGGWDERFRGWGGEDHAAMRAMDTLWWPHKTLPTEVLHVWHPQLGPQGPKTLVSWRERMWEGQEDPQINSKLSHRYYAAQNKPPQMRRLVDEGRTDSPTEAALPKGRRRRNSI